ncbi:MULTISPECIES: virB8 family protein [unclassified Luteimonas]
MFGRKTPTPQVESAVSRSVNFELTVADMARRSQRRAWLVAWCAVTMSLILAGGYFVFLPLKEKVPYLVMADPYTGTATVARLQGSLDDTGITRQEAISKSNVAQFVLARESYDSGLVGQRNWRTVLSMAGGRVSPAYIAAHAVDNPRRPAAIYGASRSMHVRILSITLIGGQDQPYTGATVRFQRSLYDKSRGRSEPVDSKIATVEFSYNANLRLSDEDRLLNPLGFRVNNYRVENDYAAVPPADPMFPDPSMPQQAPGYSMPMVPAGEASEPLSVEGDPDVAGAPAAGVDSAIPASGAVQPAPANGANTR